MHAIGLVFALLVCAKSSWAGESTANSWESSSETQQYGSIDLAAAPPGAEPVSLPKDPRFENRYATVNGTKYHYLFAEPKGRNVTATVVLVHGWPDLSAGWRYQIPLLLDLGCRVICPDMMGYGGTDAPKVPPNDLRLYSMKRAADDIQQLVKQLGYQKIVIGGHDWGGVVIWRTALWHPNLVSHAFSVATPYQPPTTTYTSLEDLVKTQPQFAYQIPIAGGTLEQWTKSKQEIRTFLKGMYGRQISEKELDYYVDQYSRTGLHGPANWYRTRKVNYEDELKLDPNTKIKAPSLMITCSKDFVLKPSMSAAMGQYFDNLTKKEVAAGHWALWETPADVNNILRQWFKDQVFKSTSPR